MINRFYKTIHIKFSSFLKFVFFLRYLIAIFFVATMIFLTIPQFFDYKKKENIIKVYLSKYYGLEIKKMDDIKFKSFPLPHLEINNLVSDFFVENTYLKTQKLKIYPKLLNIYNYENFNVDKIFFVNNNLEVTYFNSKFLIQNIFNLQSKIFLKNLNIKIIDNGENVLELNNIDFVNYGFKKNKIEGNIFKRKFRINLSNDFKNIDFKLLKTGISADLKLIKDVNSNSYEGILNGKVLKSNFKFNFTYNENFLKINKFLFRNKKLSLDSDGFLNLKPFFEINLNSQIKNIDTNILKNLNLAHLFSYKNLIKQLNSEVNIFYKPELFKSNLINDLEIKTKLAYGRLSFSKNLTIDKSKFNCNGEVNLSEEFPILRYKCFFNSPNKKKLLRKIKINNNDSASFNLEVDGNLNILNKKINFNNIEINNNYKATNEDLKYYKINFENILFDETFFEIFNLQKLRKFILEAS